MRFGLILVCVLLSSPARAEYVTYQKWLSYDRSTRVAYIAGDIDGTLDVSRCAAARAL